MTYSQPQQQQPAYRPNRAALWVNDRKTAPNQPDYKGSLEISYVILQELTAAFNAGQYVQDGGGQPCIKLDFALYAQQGGVSATTGKARPILSGQLSTVAETARSAAARQQAAAQYQQPAPQPQYQQPAPQPQYQPQYQQPAPQPQYQQPAPQPQGYAAPAPMPQAAPQPAHQQPPMPPAPVQPMPGAIHGQPPAAPAPTLPQGF